MRELAHSDNIRDLSPMDHPREKFRRMGDAALSHIELLAIILGSGTAKFPVLTVCESLMRLAGGSLEKLAALDVEELCGIDCIGETRALTFLASVALAKRLNKPGAQTRVPELNDKGIVAFLHTVFANAGSRRKSSMKHLKTN